MRSKNKVSKLTVFLVLDVIVIVGVGLAINSYINAKTSEVVAYRYAKGIAPNTEIKEADIVEEKISDKALNENIVTNPQEIIGMYTAGKVHEMELVDKRDLVKDGQENALAGMEAKDVAKLRKITLPVDILSTWGGEIGRGDRVDLAFVGSVDSSQSSKKATYSKVFMQNVLVYDVLSSSGESYVKPSDRPPIEIDPENPQAAEIAQAEMDRRKDIKSVVLAVTVDQFEEISARKKVGAIELVGKFDQSESYETSGFAINEIDEPLTLGPTKTESRDTVIVKDSKSKDWK